jgi:hypothetical protein
VGTVYFVKSSVLENNIFNIIFLDKTQVESSFSRVDNEEPEHSKEPL